MNLDIQVELIQKVAAHTRRGLKTKISYWYTNKHAQFNRDLEKQLDHCFIEYAKIRRHNDMRFI